MIEGLEFPVMPSWLYWRIEEESGEPTLKLMDTVSNSALYSSWFRNLTCRSMESIPEFGKWTGGVNNTQYYMVPVNPEGIRHVADKLAGQYLAKVKEDERMAPFYLDPEPYFGDYR